MNNWNHRVLRELLKIQNGYAFNSKLFRTNAGVPLIRIRDLKGGNVTETRFSGAFDPTYLVNAGDLLIGMDGEFGCYQWKGGQALLNQRVCKLTEFTPNLVPKFLFYGVNIYLKEIEDLTGFTTVKHLSSKQIASIRFPVPPISEQKRIVAILDEAFVGIDAAIANTEKNLANARELFASCLNSIIAEDNPSWSKATIEQLVEGRKIAKPADGNHGEIHPKKADFVGAGVPFIMASDLRGGSVDQEHCNFLSRGQADSLRTGFAKNGDVLLSSQGHNWACSNFVHGVRLCDADTTSHILPHS